MATAQLQHDPRTKQTIKDTLYAYLYDPIQAKLDKQIKELVVANARALKSSQTGFVYRNQWYTLEPGKRPPRRKDRLVASLKPRMEEYLREVGHLNTQEIPYVLGFINQVLNSSEDMQDYLQVLPTGLHPPLQEMIDACPCKTTKLAPETVDEMIQRNQVPIDMIKSRLVLNLLLQ